MSNILSYFLKLYHIIKIFNKCEILQLDRLNYRIFTKKYFIKERTKQLLFLNYKLSLILFNLSKNCICLLVV